MTTPVPASSPSILERRRKTLAPLAVAASANVPNTEATADDSWSSAKLNALFTAGRRLRLSSADSLTSPSTVLAEGELEQQIRDSPTE